MENRWKLSINYHQIPSISVLLVATCFVRLTEEICHEYMLILMLLMLSRLLLISATSWENLFLPYANNKGADQPAHPRSLISTFVIRYLGSIIPLGSTSKISSLWLVFVAEEASLSLTWSETPKTGFLVTRLICNQLFSPAQCYA